VSQDLIAPRLLGVYDPAQFPTPPLPVSFFDGGAVNYPRPSDGVWFLTQYRRWGLLRGDHDDTAIAAAINQTGLYREAAALAGVRVPEQTRADVLVDNRTWDGTDPAAYLDGFAVRA
jgi:hypothetical protein